MNQDQKLALSTSIANRKTGDHLVFTNTRRGESFEVVYIRDSKSGPMVMGKVCECETHVEGIVPESYEWDYKRLAMLINGEVPSWWQDCVVDYTPGKYVGIAKDVKHLPVSFDVSDLVVELAYEQRKKKDPTINPLADQLVRGTASVVATYNILQSLGVTMSQEQYAKMLLIFAEANHMKRVAESKDAMESFVSELSKAMGIRAQRVN